MFKMHYKKQVTHLESRDERSESAWEHRIVLYKSDQQQQNMADFIFYVKSKHIKGFNPQATKWQLNSKK